MANDLKSITHNVIMVKESSETIYKMYRLEELLKELGDHKTALIFTNTKKSADSLTKALNKAGGYRVTTIHGDKSQSERKSSSDGFSKKIYNVLVSTEEAARGIELPESDHGVHVINYDLPADFDIYTRQTARAGKKTGIATTFFTEHRYSYDNNDDLLGEIMQVVIESNSPVSPELRRYCKDNRLL